MSAPFFFSNLILFIYLFFTKSWMYSVKQRSKSPMKPISTHWISTSNIFRWSQFVQIFAKFGSDDLQTCHNIVKWIFSVWNCPLNSWNRLHRKWDHISSIHLLYKDILRFVQFCELLQYSLKKRWTLCWRRDLWNCMQSIFYKVHVMNE